MGSRAKVQLLVLRCRLQWFHTVERLERRVYDEMKAVWSKRNTLKRLRGTYYHVLTLVKLDSSVLAFGYQFLGSNSVRHPVYGRDHSSAGKKPHEVW